MFTYKAV